MHRDRQRTAIPERPIAAPPRAPASGAPSLRPRATRQRIRAPNASHRCPANRRPHRHRPAAQSRGSSRRRVRRREFAASWCERRCPSPSGAPRCRPCHRFECQRNTLGWNAVPSIDGIALAASSCRSGAPFLAALREVGLFERTAQMRRPRTCLAESRGETFSIEIFSAADLLHRDHAVSFAASLIAERMRW